MQGQIDHNLFVTIFWAFFFAVFAVSFTKAVARGICFLLKKGFDFISSKISNQRSGKCAVQSDVLR